MLKLLPDYLKTKKICIRAVKKLLFVMRYVSDWYKTRQMCDKVMENDGTLGLFLIVIRAKKCVITLFVIILMH